MNADILSEWYRRQGHRVIHTPSSYWFNAGPWVYQAFPFGWLIEPSESELRQLMVRQRILSLRYSTPIESPLGKVSYHITLSNPYNMELLRCQARNAVRRGLSKCQVENIPFERLAEQGWKLQRDTLDRQKRLSSMKEAEWKRLCYAAIGLEGFEAWAAVVDGELAAALLTTRIGDTFYVLYSLCHRKFLNLYVNSALFYSVSCNMLSREGINSVFLTVQSLDAPNSVDEFKFRMGFKARVIRQRVVFNPMISPFITKATHRVIANLLERFPTNAYFAKVEGMIRFYLQGRLPLADQIWPKCVAQSRSGYANLRFQETKVVN